MVVAVCLLLPACGSMRQNRHREESRTAARAEIRGFVVDSLRGTVLFRELPLRGLRISGEIRGLISGHAYSLRIHAYGSCSNPQAPGESYAAARVHGHRIIGIPRGLYPAGDLPGIRADRNGVARFDFFADAQDAGPSSVSVMGRSLVLHLGSADHADRPAGASATQIACGVIETGGG